MNKDAKEIADFRVAVNIFCVPLPRGKAIGVLKQFGQLAECLSSFSKIAPP